MIARARDYSGQIGVLRKKEKGRESQDGKYLLSNNNYLALNARSDKDTDLISYLRRMRATLVSVAYLKLTTFSSMYLYMYMYMFNSKRQSSLSSPLRSRVVEGPNQHPSGKR